MALMGRKTSGADGKTKLTQLLNGEAHGKLKVIKVDPSRPVRYVSVKHSGGTNFKGLRLLDEDEEYIVNVTWYKKGDGYTEAGTWTT